MERYALIHPKSNTTIAEGFCEIDPESPLQLTEEILWAKLSLMECPDANIKDDCVYLLKVNGRQEHKVTMKDFIQGQAVSKWMRFKPKVAYIKLVNQLTTESALLKAATYVVLKYGKDGIYRDDRVTIIRNAVTGEVDVADKDGQVIFHIELGTTCLYPASELIIYITEELYPLLSGYLRESDGSYVSKDNHYMEVIEQSVAAVRSESLTRVDLDSLIEEEAEFEETYG